MKAGRSVRLGKVLLFEGSVSCAVNVSVHGQQEESSGQVYSSVMEAEATHKGRLLLVP